MTNPIPSTVPEYSVWENMGTRCHNPKVAKFADYGARGIRVCERWRGKGGFQRFYEDMGPRPSRRHQIDRIDVNGDYTAENCRWVLPTIQQRNKRCNRRFTLGSETKTASEWAAQLGMTQGSLCERIEHGWSVERALTTPPRRGRWKRAG